MLAYERKQQILELMKSENKFISVEKLCAEVFASGATIRRDLKELEESKLIRRTRGGAVLMESGSNDEPLAFRENKNSMRKQVIADQALKHIHDGMTLFLDPSSTVFALARELSRFSNLKVITNSLKTAMMLSDTGKVKVICTGGILNETSKSMVGESACSSIRRFNADLAFMSCRGFSLDRGVSEASEDQCVVKRQYLENCKRAILLTDTSKMDVDYLYRLADLSEFYCVITEKKEVNDRLRRTE